ncbi:MAG: hypothetical protein JRD68_07005 [Deltaproteobacteria bacterium]|nr:hypothetical protein [Deltaproteobacteria bacterium]
MDASCLFLWCTNSGIPMALRVMEAWGFTYKTDYVWVLSTKNGGVHGRLPGYWSYSAHETLLFGTRGKFKRDGAAAPFKSVFMEPFVRGSGYKPPSIYKQIADYYAGPYLEIFAADRKPGWFGYGNQLPGGSDISIPEWDSTTQACLAGDHEACSDPECDCDCHKIAEALDEPFQSGAANPNNR